MNEINFFYATTEDEPMGVVNTDKQVVYDVKMNVITGLLLKNIPNNYYFKITDINNTDIIKKQHIPSGQMADLGNGNGFFTQIKMTLTIKEIRVYQNLYFKFHLYDVDGSEITTAKTRFFVIGGSDESK